MFQALISRSLVMLGWNRLLKSPTGPVCGRLLGKFLLALSHRLAVVDHRHSADTCPSSLNGQSDKCPGIHWVLGVLRIADVVVSTISALQRFGPLPPIGGEGGRRSIVDSREFETLRLGSREPVSGFELLWEAQSLLATTGEDQSGGERATRYLSSYDAVAQVRKLVVWSERTYYRRLWWCGTEAGRELLYMIVSSEEAAQVCVLSIWQSELSLSRSRPGSPCICPQDIFKF
ncbi:hypothetical protein QBC35DRAFT_160599 [Podospora australis]|uniref:Uncharacterized protein n=1 Tax=Podospora australis TaxID=1536484 RepID=A0AAN6X6D5_9PEZI|nr:hypothetical protein QBC35DRAFT_160599 [Podospora australis]